MSQRSVATQLPSRIKPGPTMQTFTVPLWLPQLKPIGFVLDTNLIGGKDIDKMAEAVRRKAIVA
jgi:hypothetical protein